MRERPSNEELALRARRGDGDAFAELAVRYRGLIARRAAGIAARSSGEYDPEDLRQEGLIGLMSAVRAYRAGRGAEFGTFAALCIDRRICSAVRRSFAQKQVPVGAVVSLREEEGFPDTPIPAGDERDPESALLRKEERQRFQRRLNGLTSPFERSVLRLYLEGFGYREIAARLSSTPKAVDNALQRVRRKLKQK